MIRVLLADDHAIVRGGVKQLLALTEDIEVAAEAVDGAQVMEQLLKTCFDLVLLDMSMPGISGVDLITHIRRQQPALPILVLSMRNEPQLVRHALNAGASGYLTKDNEPETLVAAIRKTAGGGRFIDPLLVEQMVFGADTPGPNQAHQRLSNREFHILCLLAHGQSVNQIAAKLSISNKTVSTHKARLMQKMAFENNADLVRYGMAHALLE